MIPFFQNLPERSWVVSKWEDKSSPATAITESAICQASVTLEIVESFGDAYLQRDVDTIVDRDIIFSPYFVQGAHNTNGFLPDKFVISLICIIWIPCPVLDIITYVRKSGSWYFSDLLPFITFWCYDVGTVRWNGFIFFDGLWEPVPWSCDFL